MHQQLYLLRRRKPKLRAYKLPPEFASDYIKVLRLLSRKHRIDDADHVKRSLRLLRVMSREALKAKRGDLWIPSPDRRTGYYPIIENIPYTTVRTMIRKNTSEDVRERARGAIAASAEPFIPQFTQRPGSLSEAQRRSLLAHIMIAFPHTKGRHPAFLGKRVPGDIRSLEPGTRSIIPIKQLAPEDWERGFTMRKFGMFEDLAKTLKKRATRKPRVICPMPHPPKTDLKLMLKRAMDTKVKLEPERSNYDRVSKLEALRKEHRKAIMVEKRSWLERLLVGKANITVAEAKRLAAKHVPAGTEIHIKKNLPAMYYPMLKMITTEPQASSIVHEATHARQHEKLGRAYMPAKAIPAGLGTGAAGFLGMLRGFRVGRFRRLPRWVAPAAAMAGQSPQLTLEGHAAIKSWKEKGGKRGAAATLGSYIPAAALGGLVIGEGAAAAGRFLRGRKAAQLQLVRRLVQKKMHLGRYTLLADRLCYEDGFRTRMEEIKRGVRRKAKLAWRWLKGEALPTVARGATLSVAELAETELGMGPTTIDLQPIRRIGLKPQYQPFPSNQLRGVVAELQAQLVREVDPVLRKGLERGVSDIATELAVRSALL